MKNAIEHVARKGFILQQFRRGATGIKRLRGKHHNAPVPSSVMPGRGRLGNAIVAVLSLALLLFSLIGMVAAIRGAYALTPNQLSASSLATKPTKTPPPRYSPTPTTVPSPTPTTTPSPAPSPTFTATPTTIATVPASATPPVKATTSSGTGKPGGSQRPTPVSTLPTTSTGSPAVQHLSQVQQKGEVAFFPIVISTLSGIAAFALLVAVGLLLLRKWLMPMRKVKLPPSGAAPWQRVRTTSLHGSMNNSGYSIRKLPTTDAFLPTTRNIIPSRKGFSFTTSNFVPKWQSMLSMRHFLRPTRLKAINNSGMPAAAKGNNSIIRHNARQIESPQPGTSKRRD